jgi:NAD(P)-dependent dehydrogenase (short-subunit alcohol dehydrogenase family)
MTTHLKDIDARAGRLLSLENKVAMVTGAASGIGRGITIRLAEMGACVSLLDIDDKGCTLYQM